MENQALFSPPPLWALWGRSASEASRVGGCQHPLETHFQSSVDRDFAGGYAPAMPSFRRCFVLVPIVLSALAGCFLFPKPKPTEEIISRSAEKREVEAAFELQSRLIERPAGDDYLARSLWSELNDPLPHRHAALLAANGLRLGIVRGTVPPELERLMTSEAAVVEPMLRTMAPDRPKIVPVNGPHERIAYRYCKSLSERGEEASFEGAECGWAISLQVGEEGRTTITLEPILQHGSKQRYWNTTGTEFEVTDQRPRETFPGLKTTLALEPAELLILGATAEPAGTIGEAFCYPPSGTRQRILVLQARTGSRSANSATSGVAAALVK